MRHSPIAGHRRVPRLVLDTPTHVFQVPESGRLMPALDYDDGSSRRSRQALESTRPGRRARMRRMRWFALGLVVGGLVGAISQLAPFAGDEVPIGNGETPCTSPATLPPRRRKELRVPHEVVARVDCHERQALALDGLAPPLEPVDERDDAGDLVTGVAQPRGSP